MTVEYRPGDSSTDEGFCSVGGNYKLLQYRTKAAMDKSIAWYASKGYKAVAPVAA